MSTAGRLPLHVQISEALARDIEAGVLADGSRLPPEREMAAGYGIAVGTLRKALADLTEKGLLERVQGSGNYVRRNRAARTVYGLFHLELVSGGGLPTAEVLDVTRMEKPTDLPIFGTTRKAHRIRRLRWLNGSDAALEEIWLDGSWAERLDKDELAEALYVYFREKLDLWITRADDSVGVAAPPDWRPAGFGSDLPVWGYVERIGYTRENMSAEFSRTWFDPQTARFVARWS